MTASAALAELATRSPEAIHAVTDVTGFGLLGHAREVALAAASLFESITELSNICPAPSQHRAKDSIQPD